MIHMRVTLNHVEECIWRRVGVSIDLSNIRVAIVSDRTIKRSIRYLDIEYVIISSMIQKKEKFKGNIFDLKIIKFLLNIIIVQCKFKDIKIFYSNRMIQTE